MPGKEIRIKAKDGSYISAVARNFGGGPVRGVVIVVHGFGEHSGCYDELAERLEQANYASVIHDQRGHGKMSEQSLEKRKKLYGIIPSYQSFLDDIGSITAEMKQKAPGVPFILYGHSMGGNIAVNYLLKFGRSDFTCAILEAPWLGLYDEVSPPTAAMARILGLISPKIAIIKKLPLGDITSVETKVEKIGNDSLYHNRISMRMFTGVSDGCTYAMNNASRISIPTYLAIAGRDRIVSSQAIREFAGACKPYATTKEYESHHSIHNDVKKEEFYRDVIAFADAHCPVMQTI